MTTIFTTDDVSCNYMTDALHCFFGARWSEDRRYWTAWAVGGRFTPGDCYPGVMDDFGNLVPVPSPGLPSQH